VLFLAGTTVACRSLPVAPTQVPRAAVPGIGPIPAFDHIFVIVMENKEYGDVIGSNAAPYENKLAQTFASADRYHGVAHPSLPNYLALVSGSTQGRTDDCATCSFDAPNLVDQLEARGKSWAAYEEGLPAPCFNGPEAVSVVERVIGGGYVRRHNPLMYFRDVSGNPARCSRVVPLTAFADDVTAGRLPDFVWITPNLRHDMHDGSVAEGDAWLLTIVPSILDSPAWQNNGLLVITWDEGTTNAGCCGSAAGGHVPTLVLAAAGKRGYHSAVPYSHYSLLRSIEDAWQLGHLGHAGDPQTSPMADFFG
jgi:acid phosphatase